MTKKKMLVLFGGLLVLILGSLAYLGIEGSNNSTADISGPPALQQNQSLTGSLSVDGRWFTVDNVDNLSGVTVNATKSNFFVFTLSPNFVSDGIDAFKDKIVVSSGQEGFVLGSYEDSRWKLSPEKNYLGAQLMQEDELRACGTYFLIKIHHDPDNSPKASFDLNYDFVSNVTQGSENCDATELGLKANEWNLISTKLTNKDEFNDLTRGFDEYLSVWDTVIINQAGNVNQPGTQAYIVGRNDANFKLFLKSNGTDALQNYFSIDNTDKQDMWVYLGNIKNNVPEMSDQTFTVDITDLTDLQDGFTVGNLVATGGDGSLEFRKLNGVTGITVNLGGEIVLSDINQIDLFNEFMAEVAETANPADKDQAQIKLIINYDVCDVLGGVLYNQKLTLESAVANSNSVDEAPFLIEPLSEDDKKLMQICAQYTGTGVDATDLQDVLDLEERVLAIETQAPSTENEGSESGA